MNQPVSRQHKDKLPLTGVRVLDLSRVLAGPLAGMMLGDMGADVIKVERPGAGDEARGWGPPFLTPTMSAYFAAINRNKKGIALDLAAEGDRAILKRLMAEADLVLDNFLPGLLERFQLNPLEMLRLYPSLIWCTITGFGPTSTRPGYDFVVQAEQGWMAITGEPDGEPMKVGVALADILTGKDAVVTLLAMLTRRERQMAAGGGPLPPTERFATISLAHSARSALVNVAQNVAVTGRDADRYGNAHPNLVPYQLFKTRDGRVVLAVGNDDQWRRALAAIGGLNDLDTDLSLRSNAGRVSQRERVVGRISERLGECATSDLIERLHSAAVPAGIVRSVAEVVAEGGVSPESGVAPAVPGAIRLAPPALGEHNEEIRRLGWRAFGD